MIQTEEEAERADHGEGEGDEKLCQLWVHSALGEEARDLRQDVGVAVQLVHLHIQVAVLQGGGPGLGLGDGHPRPSGQAVHHLQGPHYHTPDAQDNPLRLWLMRHRVLQ